MTPTPLTLMKRISKRPNVGQVAVTLVDKTILARAFPTPSFARENVLARLKAKGNTSGTLSDFTIAIESEEARPLAVASGKTIEKALELLDKALAK